MDNNDLPLQPFVQNFNLIISDSNRISNMAKYSKSTPRLINEIQNGEVDINMPLWPNDRLFL